MRNAIDQPCTRLRLGELLIQSGVLSGSQVAAVLSEQQSTGKPFGAICEDRFSVSPRTIEQAWAMQYAAIGQAFDPAVEHFEPTVASLVTRRQAWQFRVLPVRFDEQELMVATSVEHLPRALRFATNILAVPCYFVLAIEEALGHALCRHYPLPGLSWRSISDRGLDHVMGRFDVDRHLRSA